MSYEEVPFVGGLTAREIEEKWDASGKREKDVKVLANLCGVSFKKMERWLRSSGIIERYIYAPSSKKPVISEEQIESLREKSMQEYMTIRKACMELHISYEVGRRVCKEYEIKFEHSNIGPEHKKESMAKIAELAGEGLTSREISESLKMNLNTVRKYGYESGIKFAQPPRKSWRRRPKKERKVYAGR